MQSMSWKKLTGWAGVAYVVVFVLLIVVIGPEGPGIADSAAEVRDYFADNQTQIALITVLSAVAVGFFFLLFASGLRGLFASADAEDEGMWSRAMFAFAILFTAIGGVGSAFWASLGFDETIEAASDSTVKAIGALDNVIYFAVLPWAEAFFLLAASMVILRSGVLAKWLGWWALAAAVVLAVGALWPLTGDPDNFLTVVVLIGSIALLVWVAAVSVTLIRSES
jgi:hypothetical protein